MALRELLMAGEMARVGLAERLGVSQMAASRIVRDLIDAGLVVEAGTTAHDTGPGRHQTLLQIRGDGVFAAGVVLSAYSTEIAVADATGALIAQRSVGVDNISDGEAAAFALATALNGLLEDLSIPRERVVGVGIAAAAQLDPSRTHVLSAEYLGWKPFDLTQPFTRTTGLPTTAENIVNALTLAETSVGLAKGMEDVIVVRIATSIGATILQHGQIVRGHGSRAGRIGHLRHRRTDLTCSCGGKECLNCSASGWSSLVRLGIVDEQRYNPQDVKRYATEIDRITLGAPGDESMNVRLAREFRRAGSALADALLLLDQTVDPAAILLAGSMSRKPEYVDGIRERLAKSGQAGRDTISKLRISGTRAVRAAAIMALLERIYSPALDFEALCASADLEAASGAMTGTGT